MNSTPSILIVDDDADILAAMEKALSLEGFTVKVTSHVAAAEDAVLTMEPVIVFLDYYLAGENPAEFVRNVRARHPHLPVVLMTGSADAAEKAKRVGLAFYLVKPFDMNVLLAVVRRCMARARLHMEMPLRASEKFVNFDWTTSEKNPAEQSAGLSASCHAAPPQKAQI